MDERQNNKANYNLRLDYRPTSNISTMLSIRNSTKRWTEFKWLWKDVPNHMQEYQRNTGQYQFKLTHTLSEGTFYTLNLGYISTDYISTNNGREPNDFWVINKDTVYSTIGAPDRNPVTGFFDQESYETSWVNNYNEDYSIQLDLTSQILPSHQLKAGFNIHFKDLSNVNIINGASLSDYGVYLYENGIKYPKPPGPYKPFGLNRWVINGSPKTGGLYITDKFERETLIINIGIRADWYMPGSPTNNDEWKNQWKITTGLKPDWPKIHYQVDPRLGVSFPISPVTTMYFSYGHFNKFPGFENILRDPYSGGFTGNPHLSPVKTVKFEYGFTHEFPNKWAIDIKNYTKETSGQIGTTTLKAEYGLPVYMHDNKGFSRARGLEFEIRKETERFFRSNATYTLQWASGYSSSAFDDYRRSLNNLPNPIRERRLDWDVRHQVIIRASINVPANKNPSILGLKLPSNWNASLLSRLSSGQPYTPGAHNPVKRRKLHNTKTGPPSYRTDLRFEKGFIVNGLQFSAGLSIKNIFNQYNVNIHRGFNVWTGEPYQYGDRVQDTHRYYDYYDINRLLAPDRFGTGRHVDLTLEMLW
jgi:outer membrane receptor protein involved in Fe transport